MIARTLGLALSVLILAGLVLPARAEDPGAGSGIRLNTDALAACGVAAGLDLRSSDPRLIELLTSSNSLSEIARQPSVQDLLKELPAGDRLEGLKLLIECFKFRIGGAGQSRLLNGQGPIPLVYSEDQIDFYELKVCADQSIRVNMFVLWGLREMGRDQEWRRNLEKFLEALMPGVLEDPAVNRILSTNPFDIDCERERACYIYGSTPIDPLDRAITLFGEPYVKIRVRDGTCAGREGFVREAYLFY